jgi:isopentenyl-diphosphate delta-isomerase type 1
MSEQKDNMARDPARNDLLILTDLLDRQTGTATKEQAHRSGLLHRAFSVLLYRDTEDGREYLISRRADGKYHSAGLWANSCCSHPRDGETLPEAARSRVREELGCVVPELSEIGAFVYRAVFPDGLCEYEYDHVLLGRADGEPDPDPAEVAETRWISPEVLSDFLTASPEKFAPWAFTVFSMTLSRNYEKQPISLNQPSPPEVRRGQEEFGASAKNEKYQMSRAEGGLGGDRKAPQEKLFLRKAEPKDIPAILELLIQVNMVHHNGRPDLFKGPTTKYTGAELEQILRNDETPVFVCTDENGTVLGHGFCVLQHAGGQLMVEHDTLYIDDICVDGNARGRGVGRALYNHILAYAREKGCYNVTLNVWTCNPRAMAFYQKLGMEPYKIAMEVKLPPDL